MKSKKIFLPLIALMFAGMSVQAQKGKAALNVSYNVALPTGSFGDLIKNTSFRGFSGSVLFGVSDKLSLGFGTGFQDFYQKNPRQLYKLSDGSDISAVVTNSIQTIPLLATARYAFNPTGTVQPYAGIGVGGNMISYSQLYGEFGGQEAKFGFAARPEAGVFVPFKKSGESGFNLGASYNIMPFKEMGLQNLNSIGLRAGVTIPLGK